MRLGEIRGLRRENVFDDYIHVGGQFTRFGYKPATINKQSRNIPITPLVRLELEELLLVNGNGYVFSEDGGETPLPAGKVGRLFDRALNNIGINSEERMKRNLTFHAWILNVAKATSILEHFAADVRCY
ncbi:MAG: hypothetical protein FWH41_10930 [Treponema sp.]|nr:hypothetical protein [Treponema sp.]